MPGTLLAGENVIVPRTGRHWILLVRRLVAPTLAAVAALLAVNVVVSSLVPSWLRLLLTVATLVALGGVQVLLWLQWTADQLFVTSWRLLLETGIFYRTTKVIPLDDVRDVTTQQSLLGRMLDYGSVEIVTEWHGAELFTYAPRPEILRDQLFVLTEQRRRSR